MTKGMGAPGFVIPLMHLMPGAWSKLKAVAHTLPYDAQLLEGFTAGKPLSGKDWGLVTMPTLVMAALAHTKRAEPYQAGITEADRTGTGRILRGRLRSAHMKIIAPVLREFFKEEK